MSYFSNYFGGYDFESNDSVKMKKDGIDKKIKDKYEEIKKDNDKITEEELNKKLQDEFKNDIENYSKGYKIHHEEEVNRTVKEHGNYLKSLQKLEEEKKKLEDERRG